MAEAATGAHSHMQDPEAHVQAVEEDLEYYRTKRFEPRVLYFHRRGIITLYDVLRAATLAGAPAPSPTGPQPPELEARIRALEDGLDEYVREQGVVSVRSLGGVDMVVEDTRTERGDHDPFFRIAKRAHGGTIEQRVEQLEEDLAAYRWLERAFVQALVTRGLADEAQLAERRRQLSEDRGWNGARIVARAWVDPDFKQRLIETGRPAVRELGIPPGRLGKLGVAENTEGLHNVVVCTLCSCYPYDLLGDTPWWYKHDSYKQNIIRDPRGTLEEMFGFRVPDGMAVRVHDSTSDVRWMVLPRRPAGTEGLSEDELARLVTRDSLIGVAEPLQPGSVAARS